MFSPAHALRLEAPIPPMPMAARSSLLLGASCPTTRLGTMAADSAAIAAVDVNCLRETVLGESSRMRESSMDTGSHAATESSCYTESDRRSPGRSSVARPISVPNAAPTLADEGLGRATGVKAGLISAAGCSRGGRIHGTETIGDGFLLP